MKILLIDNYDSFTYNLVHYLEDLRAELTVLRNDEVELDEIASYDGLVLSPGPGIPKTAGQMNAVLESLLEEGIENRMPILGICLGHQAIIEVLGGEIQNLKRVYHGVETPMNVKEAQPLFQNVPDSFQAGRYHSWCAVVSRLPKTLTVNCTDEDGEIMGVQHKDYPVFGLQFHPESIMTPDGKTMLKNFLEEVQKRMKP